MDSELLQSRLDTACRTFQTLERQLADPEVASDPARLQAIARERARLEPLVTDYQRLRKLEQEREEARALLRAHRDDPAAEELATLASEELVSLEGLIGSLNERLTLSLLPSDPRD